MVANCQLMVLVQGTYKNINVIIESIYARINFKTDKNDSNAGLLATEGKPAIITCKDSQIVINIYNEVTNKYGVLCI